MTSPIPFSAFGDLSPNDRLVILGAGASSPLGIPLGREIQARIKARRDEMPILAGLTGEFEPTVAALDLVCEQDTAFTASHVLSKYFRLAKASPAISDAAAARREREVLVSMLRDEMYRPPTVLPTVTEQAYLQGIIDLQRGSTIISLNYDNLLEWAATPGSLLSVVRADGLDRVFVPDTVADKTRLLHMHGAITWSQFQNVVIDHYRPQLGEDDALVLGTGPKLRYYEPFLEMYQVLRDELRRVSGVLCIGFSFQDAHVVQQLSEWAASKGADGQLHICNRSGLIPEIAKPWKYQHGAHVKVWRGDAMEFVLTEVVHDPPSMLRIVSASYGLDEPNIVDLDVTEAVASRVCDGRLRIVVDDDVLGVDQSNDPAWRRGKRLVVAYEVDGVADTRTVLQLRPLNLP